MAFFNERLLDCIAYGVSGGPMFRTRRVELRNGHVLRNADWSRPMHRYAAAYQNIRKEHHAEVLHAFMVCQGACHGFLWWDRADYQVTQGEEIGETDGTVQTLQLIKTYAFASGDLVRAIRKPRADGFQLRVNGVPISSSLDETTGLVTFTAPPGGIATWEGEFDVPVTFESDELLSSIDNLTSDGEFVLNTNFSLVEDFTQ